MRNLSFIYSVFRITWKKSDIHPFFISPESVLCCHTILCIILLAAVSSSCFMLVKCFGKNTFVYFYILMLCRILIINNDCYRTFQRWSRLVCSILIFHCDIFVIFTFKFLTSGIRLICSRSSAFRYSNFTCISFATVTVHKKRYIDNTICVI